MNIQISNLPLLIESKDLKSLFEPYGEVSFASIAIDLFTDKSRGFGHVEMPDEEAAATAIKNLNKSSFHDQTILVQEAPPKQEKRGSYKVGSGSVNPYRFRKN